jgi:murein biosynthesis integral membrane protein MurJ
MKLGAIVQATTVVTVIALVVKGLGFVEKLLLAYFFGTGAQVDAYLVAYSIPFSAYVVLREVINPAYLPTFLRTRRASESDAWHLFGVTGTVLLLFLGAGTIAGMILAEPIVSLAAPGFTGMQKDLAVRLTRMVMPALLFLGLSTLTTATLQSEKRFALPALGNASFRLGPIVLLFLAGGVQGMMLGAVLGALGKLLMETVGLRRHLRQISLSLDVALAPVRTVGKLAAPLLAALFLSLFVGPLVENAFASRTGIGGVSALAFARKIAETLTTILPYALGIVLLPFSAEVAASKDQRGLARMLSGSIRTLTLLFLPVSIGLAVLREPFIRLLFERGAFTAASTQLTANPLLFYSFALLPFALEVIVIQFYFAQQDTITPVLTDVAAFIVNVAFIPILMPFFGLGGIALAAALSKALKVLILVLLFGRRVPAFRIRTLGPFAAKMTGASLVMVLLLGLLVGTTQWLSNGGTIQQMIYLATTAMVGGIGFLITAYILKVDELRILWQERRKWRDGIRLLLRAPRR